MPELTQLPVQAKLLVVAKTETVKEELGFIDPVNITMDDADPELLKQAEDYAERLASLDPKDFKAREDSKLAVENAGANLRRASRETNQILQGQIKELANRGADGGEVANALVELKLKVEELDPHQWNFSPGWFSRLTGRTPFAGRTLKRYFTKYESAQIVIDAIISSLDKGKNQLSRDNITLQVEQTKTREQTLKLEKLIKILQLVDKKLTEKLGLEQNEDKRKFLQEELLFTLRQTIMDRQQQLAVDQQGILTYEIITRNNKELIRGVDRANDVTIGALRVAVTASLALTNQRIVLDKIMALNTTTSNLIEKNAELLRTQGVEIHKQASSAMLDMEKLKAAFANIHAAMDDIARFRQEALPRMAHTILELDTMTTEAEKRIKKMEEGDRVRPSISIEVS